MADFFHWLFHTSTGVLVLLLACMVIALILAAVLERGTRRRYSDRGDRSPAGSEGLAGLASAPNIDLENAGERLRARADALVDEVDALLDRDFSDSGEPGSDQDAGSGLVGALEELWDSWDESLGSSDPDDGD